VGDGARLAQSRVDAVNPARNSAGAMTPERWQRIQDVLADAIDAPVHERSALLDVRCESDLALRQEVESLLLAHDSAGLVDELAPSVKPPDAWRAELAPEWLGRRIAQYVVQAPLSSGGMGVVYKARDEQLGRQVALKFLPPHLSANAEAKARFVAEARAAAALDHPNVCTVYQIGEIDDGRLFIAMPLYDGETLRTRLERGRLMFGEAIAIAVQVARGLEHAHQAGIVHRDVKPSNIVVLPNGTAKILDFGIAQIRDVSLADPKTVIGTIAYMSPEQATASAIDGRSDVWSLAVVVHEMLTGVRPFDGADGKSVLREIQAGEPNLIAASYPDVPEGIDRILRRALAKSPDQRHASMTNLIAELSALAPAADGRTIDVVDDLRMSTTERRRAAVLVTVIADYASLVEQMTPIEAKRLVATVRETAVDVVRSYGGIVNQAIGEEIVSLFGVPIAHDDDDLRAVRAARELHARIGALKIIGELSSITVTVKSGLHVGPVVAQRLQEGPRRYDIIGAPATVAARLAMCAEPDDIWVSPETQRLIDPYLRAAACPPVVLDAHIGAVTPFRLLGETGIATSLDASRRSGLTPYVGRESELSTLQAHIGGAARGVGRVIAVIGEPGAGKSRLLHELEESLGAAPAVRVLHARCRAYGDGVPYGVFVQVLCAALDLRTPPRNSETVVTGLRLLEPSLERFLPLFLHLLSVASDRYTLPRHLEGEHLQAALLDALATLVGVLSRRGPLCVLVEDWHWADTGSPARAPRFSGLQNSQTRRRSS
jgi:serine/threonine protein kinase